MGQIVPYVLKVSQSATPFHHLQYSLDAIRYKRNSTHIYNVSFHHHSFLSSIILPPSLLNSISFLSFFSLSLFFSPIPFRSFWLSMVFAFPHSRLSISLPSIPFLLTPLFLSHSSLGFHNPYSPLSSRLQVLLPTGRHGLAKLTSLILCCSSNKISSSSRLVLSSRNVSWNNKTFQP